MKVFFRTLFFLVASIRLLAVYSDEINYMDVSCQSRDYGLYLAVAGCNKNDVVDYIKKGAGFSYVNSNGANALQLAATFEDKTIFEFLCVFAKETDFKNPSHLQHAEYLKVTYPERFQEIKQKYSKSGDFQEPYLE